MSKKLSFELVAVRAKNDKINSIKKINLWGCELDDVSIFRKMPNLEVISLSVNNLKTLKDFKELKNLRELYLRKNNISDIRELKYLSNCSKLRTLWLSENPISQNPNYRISIIKYLPFLDKLDDIIVSENEREIASQMDSNELLNSFSFPNNINNMIKINDFSNINLNKDYQYNDKGNLNINDLNNNNNPLMSSYGGNNSKQQINNNYSNYNLRTSNNNYNPYQSNSYNNDNFFNQNDNYNSNSNMNNYYDNYNSNNLRSTMGNNEFMSSFKNMDNNTSDSKGIIDCVLILLNKLNNDQLGYVRNVIDQKMQK